MKTSGGIGGGSSDLGWNSYSGESFGGIQLGRLLTDIYEFLKFQNRNCKCQVDSGSGKMHKLLTCMNSTVVGLTRKLKCDQLPRFMRYLVFMSKNSAASDVALHTVISEQIL